MEIIPIEIKALIMAYTGPQMGLIEASRGLYRALRGIHWAMCIELRFLRPKMLDRVLSLYYDEIEKGCQLASLHTSLPYAKKIMWIYGPNNPNRDLFHILMKCGYINEDIDPSDIFKHIYSIKYDFDVCLSLFEEMIKGPVDDFLAYYVVYRLSITNYYEIMPKVFASVPQYSICMYVDNGKNPYGDPEHMKALFQAMAKCELNRGALIYISGMHKLGVPIETIEEHFGQEVAAAISMPQCAIPFAPRPPDMSRYYWTMNTEILNLHKYPITEMTEDMALFALYGMIFGCYFEYIGPLLAKISPTRFKANKLYLSMYIINHCTVCGKDINHVGISELIGLILGH
jgi:hypothetical protein